MQPNKPNQKQKHAKHEPPQLRRTKRLQPATGAPDPISRLTPSTALNAGVRPFFGYSTETSIMDNTGFTVSESRGTSIR
jgi:hypothetical protein